MKAIAIFRAAFVALAATLLGSSAALAQDWPNKPVKIIVGFGAGGTADLFGRLLANELSTAFKQQFYVENRVGSAGAIGSGQAARSDPDGYTLLIGGAGPMLTGPAVNPNIGYDTMRDFTHIAMIGGDSFVLTASNQLGAKSFADLLAKAKQDTVTCGTVGVGSQGHLVLELINREAKVKLQNVTYRGTGENITDLLGGHVSLGLLTIISAVEQVNAGKLVGIAVTTPQRNPILKDVPTFAELGYPNVRGTGWFWLTGPKGIPSDIVEKLSREVRRIVKLPHVQQQFEKAGLLTSDLDVAATNKFLGEEVALWGSLARDVGLKIQ